MLRPSTLTPTRIWRIWVGRGASRCLHSRRELQDGIPRPPCEVRGKVCGVPVTRSLGHSRAPPSSAAADRRIQQAPLGLVETLVGPPHGAQSSRWPKPLCSESLSVPREEDPRHRRRRLHQQVATQPARGHHLDQQTALQRRALRLRPAQDRPARQTQNQRRAATRARRDREERAVHHASGPSLQRRRSRRHDRER